MRIEKEDRILIIHFESGDSLMSQKKEILDSAKRENAYAISFVITDQWKFNMNEADDVFTWMKEIPYINIMVLQGEASDCNKIFSLFGEYRLTKDSYKIDFPKSQKMDLKNRCKLLYGEQINIDEGIEIQANVGEESLHDAIVTKGKEWFGGKTPEHIRALISFYKRFHENLSEAELLTIESHTFCNLINGEQVDI